jgi:Domain of unknown function (DUF1816)
MPTKIVEMWTSFLDLVGQAWWVEISTDEPKCIYYFGPFANSQVAGLAKVTRLQVKRCKPNRLTIDADMGERHDHEQWIMLNGHV